MNDEIREEPVPLSGDVVAEVVSDSAVVIERTGCRAEATKEVYRAVVVSYKEDTVLVRMDFRQDDTDLLRALVRNQDNDCLEEMFYFMEWNKAPVVIDGVKYPYEEVKELLERENRVKAPAPIPPMPPASNEPIQQAEVPVSQSPEASEVQGDSDVQD